MSDFINSFRQQLLGAVSSGGGEARQQPPLATPSNALRSKTIYGVDVSAEHPRFSNSSGCVAVSSNMKYIAVASLLPTAKIQILDCASLMCIASIVLPLSLVEEALPTGENSSATPLPKSISKVIWVCGVEGLVIISDDGKSILMATGLRNQTPNAAPDSSEDEDSEEEFDVSPHVPIGNSHLLDVDCVDTHSLDEGVVLTIAHTDTSLWLYRNIAQYRQLASSSQRGLAACISQPTVVTSLSASSGSVLHVGSSYWVVLFVGVSVLTFEVGVGMSVTAKHTLLLGQGVVPVAVLRDAAGSLVRCLFWEPATNPEATGSQREARRNHVLLVDGAAPTQLDEEVLPGNSTLVINSFEAAPLNSVVGGSRSASMLSSTSLLIHKAGSIPFSLQGQAALSRGISASFNQYTPHASSRSSKDKQFASPPVLCVASFDLSAVVTQREVTWRSFRWDELVARAAVAKGSLQPSLRFVASSPGMIVAWTSNSFAVLKMCSTENIKHSIVASSSIRQFIADAKQNALPERGLPTWSGFCATSAPHLATVGSPHEDMHCYALVGVQQENGTDVSGNSGARHAPVGVTVVEDPLLVTWRHIPDDALPQAAEDTAAHPTVENEEVLRRIIREENALLFDRIDARLALMENSIIERLALQFAKLK